MGKCCRFVKEKYPTPFNSEAKIIYEVSSQARIRLEIRNLLGPEVRTFVNKEKPIGFYKMVWDGRDASGRRMAGGVYVCQLVTDGFVQSEKMLFRQ